MLLRRLNSIDFSQEKQLTLKLFYLFDVEVKSKMLVVFRVVGRCRKCMKLDNDARLRHDFSQYRAMLKELRRSEESFEDGSKIAYLLQVWMSDQLTQISAQLLNINNI